jgi:hypothetical protein
MRFREIANPVDQLALWKLISDKMWAAFEEPVPSRPNTPLPQPMTAQGRAARPGKRAAKAVPKAPRKSAVKAKPRAAKPRRAPMAPAPKPVAIPKPKQLTPTQAAKQQAQQQRGAQHGLALVPRPCPHVTADHGLCIHSKLTMAIGIWSVSQN